MKPANSADRHASLEATPLVSIAAVGGALVIAATVLVGWAAGIDALTRIIPAWPRMTSNTAVLIAALGLAILMRSGRQSFARLWVGTGAAAVAGVVALLFLAEYAMNRSFGLDQMLFFQAEGSSSEIFPGRPSPPTLCMVVLLSVAAGLSRLDRRWSRLAWGVALAAATATVFVYAAAYALGAAAFFRIGPTVGIGILTVIALGLLVTGAFAARPDRNPVAWLLARPDRKTLIQMAGILAAIPILVGFSWSVFAGAGLNEETVHVLSVSIGSVLAVAAAAFIALRGDRLLLEKERLIDQLVKAERERADAEMRYRLVAENSVDVISHLRGREVVWASPSVEDAFGWPPEKWIGTDFSRQVHPDDLDATATVMQGVAYGELVVTRCRCATADGGYRWVEARGKPYIDEHGNPDGMIFASRIIDEQVAAEQRLDRLAKQDQLTGLINREETLARIESALENPRCPGPHLGLLFCDVDHFKDINDTWGHVVGDAVLSTLAARITDCVRAADTVGRIGGDEMLVLLPGMHNIDEIVQIAKKIQCRAAEPIRQFAETVDVTLSIGATLSLPDDTVSMMTIRADAAMYEAKRSGRNTVVATRFEPPD